MAHVATLTIDHTKVAGDLTDYVVAVINNSDAGWAELYAVATEGGGDIRAFKDDDTTELPREIVSFSVSSETGRIFIKYSGTLSSTVDTDIHFYADGTSSDYAVSATYGRDAVYDNYSAVYHLNSTTDATGGGKTLTAEGGATAGNDTTSPLGYGTSYDGSNDDHTTPDSTDFNALSGSYTLQCWVKTTEENSGYPIFGQYGGGEPRWAVRIQDGTTTSLYTRDGSGTVRRIRASGLVNNGAWRKIDITGVAGGSSSDFKFYTDGADDTGTVQTHGTDMDSAFALDIAATPIFSWYSQAVIAEIRIRKSVLPATWIETEHDNQDSPSTFYSVTAIDSGVERALTATAEATATLIKEIPREIQVTAEAGSVFTRSVGKTIQTTAEATASIALSLAKVLSVVAEATASIMKTQVTLIAMTVTAEASALISKLQLQAVMMSVTASATASMEQARSLSRALTATAQATASVVQSGLIISRELAVTASATVTRTVGLTLTRVLTATGRAVATIAKDFGYLDKYPENDATYEDKYPEN